MPKGKLLQQRMDRCDLNTVQGRIKYYRLKAGYMPNEMAQKIGLKDGYRYTNLFEYVGNPVYYTSLARYHKLCNVLGIRFEGIADEYLLFINSNYDELLQKAINISGLPSSLFAEKHGLEYTTLRHSLKRMHKLSVQTSQKYIRVLKSYGLY